MKEAYYRAIRIGAAALLLIYPCPPSLPESLTLADLNPPLPLPLSSGTYSVEDVWEMPSHQGILAFRVHSPHADYEAESFVALVKLLHEIEVIERVRTSQEGSGFFDGFADSVASTGSGFVRLVSSPGESVKGVGRAFGKLGRKIGGVFQSQEEGEKSSWGEKMLGGSERELAKRFGVDAYTRNPYMQELLRRTAKSRIGGKSAAAIGKLLIPVALLVSVAVTASGVNSAADHFVNDAGRGDIYEKNYRALTAMGFKLSEVRMFLNLPYYTPRESTYIRFYLEKLRGIEGSGCVFQAARSVMNPEEALAILYSAQLAADGLAGMPSYKRVACFQEGVAAEQAGKLILFSPYDYLNQGPLGDRVLRRVGELKRAWGLNSAEIRNGGKMTPAFSARAARENVRMRDWMLFKKEQ